MAKEFFKTPYEKLDYKFGFAQKTAGSSLDPKVTDYLTSGETITAFNLSASALNGGSVITLSGSTLSDYSTSVLFWISGGELHKDCEVNCVAETSESRTVHRTMVIRMIDEK